ncbi:MAG: histidine--tRNA ligase, partial [Acidimicrobiia bacterium]|nr:histidine--tRNA ligase [Acidimicrobiia bacterium]
SAQNGIGGGGRYDALTEQLGGPPTPGIGFGIGIERVLLACDAEGVFAAPPAAVAVFVVDVTGSVALRLVEELREAGVGADRAFDRRSMKAQFKLADRSGARLAVVVGPDEMERGIAKLQSLTGDDKEEEDVKLEELVERVKARLGPA